MSEQKRPIKLQDNEFYRLITVKRRNEGIELRGVLQGKDILVKNYFKLAENDYVISKRQVVHGANGIVPSTLHGAIVSNEYLILSSNNLIKTEFLVLLSQRKEMYKIFFLSSYGIDIEKLVFDVNDFKKRKIILPSIAEQTTIGNFFRQLDKLIALHQGKLDKVKTLKKGLLQKMFPAQGETVPQIRFPQFTDDWEQRKFGDVWQSTSVRNTNLEFGANDIISVAQMKLAPSENKSSDEYMKTYNILRVGDIAFEGNKSKKFAFGRFVLNDLQDGIVSHVFNVYRPCIEMDISFMKIYINNENVMRHILVKATTKTVMMTTLNAKDIVKQNIYLPTLAEQTTIGNFFRQFDDLISLHQRKLEHLKMLKKSLLQQMFV